MAHCYNCGCEIPEDDRTRLCDECKKVLLPFVKFMDASTSSAVRRLVSNEANLRSAGVTDSGMEYLLRICELHDRKKSEESAQTMVLDRNDVDEAFDAPDEYAGDTMVMDRPIGSTGSFNRPDPQYSEVEIPLDQPINIIRHSYGQYLTAAEIILGIVSAALLIWFFVDLFLWIKVDFTAVAGCIASAVGVYVTDTVRRMLHDVEELKKHFR